MKKTIAASVAGLLLVAGQAAATTQAAPRIADRVGAPAGESSDFAGVPAGLLFAAVTVLASVAITSVNDDSESD